MNSYPLKAPLVNPTLLLLAGCLLLFGLAGCGLRFGGPQTVSWYPESVSGSTLEPGLREVLQSEFQRAVSYRGVHTGLFPLRVTIESVTHQRSLSASQSTDVAWRSQLVVRYDMVDRPECGVTERVEQLWLASGSDPGLANGSRADAVQKLARLASERGLDRLLGKASCR